MCNRWVKKTKQDRHLCVQCLCAKGTLRNEKWNLYSIRYCSGLFRSKDRLFHCGLYLSLCYAKILCSNHVVMGNLGYPVFGFWCTRSNGWFHSCQAILRLVSYQPSGNLISLPTYSSLSIYISSLLAKCICYICIFIKWLLLGSCKKN